MYIVDVFNSIVLPSGEEEPIWGANLSETGESTGGIPNQRLYIRYRHEISKETGSVLTDPQFEYKLSEYIKADPFGVGKILLPCISV